VGVRAGEKNGSPTAELAVLEIVDTFGQRSVLTFSRVQVNPAIPAETFRFRPPAGADVIRQ
jgi:outer membrane lipoprotein carrier protein